MFDNDAHLQSYVHMSSDGSAVWAPGGVFLTSCALDISLFPFDHQTCDLVFGSWMHSNTSIHLRNRRDSVGITKYSENNEWDLVKTEAFTKHLAYAGLPSETFPMVTFRVHLRRKTTYYVVNVIGPCVLMSMMELLAFLLPPESGEKVTLGVTVLLSFIVFLLFVAENIPRSSDAVPLIGKQQSEVRLEGRCSPLTL